MKQKANISIWTRGLKCDDGFDLGHDIDIWIFKVICDLDHLVTKVRCKDLPVTGVTSDVGVPSTHLVYSTIIQVQIKQNIKALRHWPLCWEFTSDRWIPHTKDQ